MKYMQKHEQQQAEVLIDLLLADGCKVSVFDGEEWPLKQSSTRSEILGAMCSTSDDKLSWRDSDGNHKGSFWIIYGNGPQELVADHSDNEACNAIWNKLQEQTA